MTTTRGYDDLVVDDGDAGRASGGLHAFPAGFRVVDARSWSLSSLVPVRSVQLDLAAYQGSDVTASGIWRSGVLMVDRVDVIGPAPPAPPQPGADGVFGARPRHRDPREAQLIEDGLLLDLWPEDGEPDEQRQVALATDVSKVREVLEAIHGPTVRVVRSRWAASMFDQLDAVLVTSKALRSIGRAIGPDEQMQVAATLLNLSSDMAGELERFPVAALDVCVLVTPDDEPQSFSTGA